MIQAILFDKDGTLFDFYRTWGTVTEEAALLATGGDKARAADLMLKSGKDAVTGRINVPPFSTVSGFIEATNWRT